MVHKYNDISQSLIQESPKSQSKKSSHDHIHEVIGQSLLQESPSDSSNSEVSQQFSQDMSNDDVLEIIYRQLFQTPSYQLLQTLLDGHPRVGRQKGLVGPPPSELGKEEKEEEEVCTVFWAGLSYGHVGMHNNFQVWVRNNNIRDVNVSVHGPEPHCVTETSTMYTGDNLYEVIYQVSMPGLYIISVKVADQKVPNSPFVARIASEV